MRGVSGDHGGNVYIFFFRNNIFWWFSLIFKIGRSSAPWFIHMLQKVLHKHRVPTWSWAHGFTWHTLVSSSERGSYSWHRSQLTPTSDTTAITSAVFFRLTNVVVLVLLGELLLTLGTGSSPWAKKESVFSRENMSGKIKNTFYLCFRFLKRLF